MHAGTVSIIANYFDISETVFGIAWPFLLMAIPITLGFCAFDVVVVPFYRTFSRSLTMCFSQRVNPVSFASPTKSFGFERVFIFISLSRGTPNVQSILFLLIRLILPLVINFRVKNENRKFRFIFEIQHILFILMVCCCRCIVQHCYKIWFYGEINAIRSGRQQH